MLILINLDIVVIVLDSMHIYNFHYLILAGVVIFGVDNSCSLHVDNRKKNILTDREGKTQGLDDTKKTGETKYSICFTESGKKFVLSLH